MFHFTDIVLIMTFSFSKAQIVVLINLLSNIYSYNAYSSTYSYVYFYIKYTEKRVINQTWYSFLSKEIFTGLSALVICSFSRNSVVFWTVTGALSISWRVRNMVLYCSWKKIILVIILKKKTKSTITFLTTIDYL